MYTQACMRLRRHLPLPGASPKECPDITGLVNNVEWPEDPTREMTERVHHSKQLEILCIGQETFLVPLRASLQFIPVRLWTTKLVDILEWKNVPLQNKFTQDTDSWAIGSPFFFFSLFNWLGKINWSSLSHQSGFYQDKSNSLTQRTKNFDLS